MCYSFLSSHEKGGAFEPTGFDACQLLISIGREISAAGELRADGVVVLDGSFSGDIHCRTAKITGRLTGNLRCRRAVLRGAAVIGDVSAFVFDADGASRVFGKLIAGKIVRPGAR